MPDNRDVRFGINTPKRSGKAVQRNRIKRIMRETYRLNKEGFPQTGALLYVIKNCQNEDRIKEEMFDLADKLLLIIKANSSANQNDK